MFNIRTDTVLIDEQGMDFSKLNGLLATAGGLPNSGNTNSTDPATGGELSYGHLSFLTLQAVTQTIIICFAGFVVARVKILTPNVQKHISTLNVQLLTPALIFTKLASSLSLSALIDIAVIPILFVVTTGISLSCARLVSRLFRFDKAESNFVSAMAVFGNSNSLPVSLTVSLAYTLPNLMWPDIENDSQDNVASRGILYLLIFQQLGQIVRWSWGYNTLLVKPTVSKTSSPGEYDEESRPSFEELQDASESQFIVGEEVEQGSVGDDDDDDDDDDDQVKLLRSRSRSSKTRVINSELTSISTVSEEQAFHQKAWATTKRWFASFMSFMNPPLWSMLIAIAVASVPPVKHEIFESNGFVQNTFTKAIQQIGGMAIPMILLVLGSNLAPNEQCAPASPRYKSIVFASLLCRMVLPAFFLLPIIACSVKYLQISILDDPIFLVVAFVLTVSPPAIQLSQICQLNEFFEKEMAGVLFWGYVILTLPSTIIIVVSSLEVLEWAGTTVS